MHLTNLKYFKKHILILGLSINSILSYGQKNSRWQLSFQLQPELTFHKNDYAQRWSRKYTKSTFSIGLSSTILCNLTAKVFIEGGLGFLSRKLNAKVFVDQALLPPPYYDSILVTYVSRSVSFRTLEIPIGIGYYFIKRKNKTFFLKGSYISNFLLNTKYRVNNYPSFKKNYWQGHSIIAGIGADYLLNKKIILTNTLSYSITNTVKKDNYLYSQDERNIALTHTFLQISTGIKINF